MSYDYYLQRKRYVVKGSDGRMHTIQGGSDVCTNVVDAYLAYIDAPYNILQDLLVMGYASIELYAASDITLSTSIDNANVIATYKGVDISDSMIYLRQSTATPYGQSVITPSLKSLYRQHSISIYFENEIIKELGRNQKYFLGVSQTLKHKIEDSVTLTDSEYSKTPNAGVFQRQDIKALVEASSIRLRDYMPSNIQLRYIRDTVVDQLNNIGIKASPKAILTDNLFKVAEGLQMMPDVLSINEIREALI